LQLFVERELASLLEHDRGSTVNLVEAVRALLWHPSSKTDAAASLHLSRAAFYARLKKAEQVIRADLDDPDIRLSLHLAILAMELAPRERDPGISIRRAGAQRPGD
jgi:purine catabolism regulator